MSGGPSTSVIGLNNMCIIFELSKMNHVGLGFMVGRNVSLALYAPLLGISGVFLENVSEDSGLLAVLEQMFVIKKKKNIDDLEP